MLKECIEVFKCQMDQNEGRLVLDTHLPADGTYLVVGNDGKIKHQIEIKKDKKTKQIDRSPIGLNDVIAYDYNSLLVSMNKPMDPKKVIHSNSYLSFAIKKDSLTSGKLTDGIIDGYYHILSDPLGTKYKKSKEASRIYQEFEENEGKPDKEKIEWIAKWIKEHIFQLPEINMEEKNYLKIYFEADKEEYERENRRYLLPNIYNSNEYNTVVEDKIYGMPDNNLGMNAKKPFLSIKTRKNPAPYLLGRDEVVIQKQFFDYLMNLASEGKYHIYIDTENNVIRGCTNGNAPGEVLTGYYLRITKGKNEAEIQEQDNISGYKQKLDKTFVFENILDRKEVDDRYRAYDNRLEIGRVINEILFSKWLSGNNYIADAKDISVKDETLKKMILESRKSIFDWIFKGIDHGIANTIQCVAMDAIKNAVMKEYIERALCQFNLMWSFRKYFSEEGEEDMGEIITELRGKVVEKVKSAAVVPIESDDEYYYCVGQLARYLISLSKAKDITHSLLNPIINAKTDEILKKKIMQMYKRFNYRISNKFKRTETLFAMVMGYVPEGKVNQEKVLLGYACDSAIYDKNEKGENKDE